MRSVSLSMTFFGRRNSGAIAIIPPALSLASYTVTAIPLLAITAAAASPDGPAPITATL
jgi:hypothetical protein